VGTQEYTNASDSSRVDATMAMRSQRGGVVIELSPSRRRFDVHFLYYQSMSNYPNFRLSELTPVPINSDNRWAAVPQTLAAVPQTPTKTIE
jgi:hypothetical protein